MMRSVGYDLSLLGKCFAAWRQERQVNSRGWVHLAWRGGWWAVALAGRACIPVQVDRTTPKYDCA